jgi:hypothetical protein
MLWGDAIDEMVWRGAMTLFETQKPESKKFRNDPRLFTIYCSQTANDLVGNGLKRILNPLHVTRLGPLVPSPLGTEEPILWGKPELPFRSATPHGYSAV